ncbi:MAG: hypothetical protein IIB56_09595 [Planctomycetes bacterium]|nr:hypothetical protein [Planctomycetota bacterium]
MNINSLITKDYRRNAAFAVRKNKPNSNPIFLRTKMNATLFTAKDYENETAFMPKKNKPNSKPIFKRMNVNFCTKGYYKSKLKALKKPPLLEVNSESLRKDW